MDERFVRRFGDLHVQIDPDLCVGFGDCIEETPGAFELNDEGIAVFTRPEETPREALVRACEACPVDAIVIRDESGHVAP